MKLFVKYNRVNILASILALLLGSTAYYFIIRYTLIHQLDDTLKVEEAEILDAVNARRLLPEPTNYRDQQIQYTPAVTPVRRTFSDTVWHGGHHHGYHPVRQLQFSVKVDGQLYTVSISKSEVEAKDLLAWIMLISAAMVLLLLGTLFMANRLLLRRIWQPFYSTLEGIRQFQLSSRQSFATPPATDIEEFRNLDAAVGQMTQKIFSDYEMLKNFADNASHEMQTPLAIINSKLDLMIQDPELAERHLRQLQAMYDAVGRLSRMNQSLLLLTKIENNQFPHMDTVDLASLIGEKLIQLEDLIRERSITVQSDLDRNTIYMNGYLADILLNNLLVNAIRHNQEGGLLHISLHGEELRISNTGAVLSFEPSLIFDRFTKGSHSTGTGLGLAIVKQICDNYNFILDYSFNDNLHTISIRFPSPGFRISPE